MQAAAYQLLRRLAYTRPSVLDATPATTHLASKAATALSWPNREEAMSGVTPPRLAFSVDAPCCSSSSTAVWWPRRAASSSAVSLLNEQACRQTGSKAGRQAMRQAGRQ
jgi:hypothetical protein